MIIKYQKFKIFCYDNRLLNVPGEGIIFDADFYFLGKRP
jgi:hypothetical protein